MTMATWEIQAGEEFIQADHLHPNPDNPRQRVEGIAELAESIRQQGLLQALLVRPAPDIGPGHYYIEAGERRWRAMKTWNSTIRCFVRPALPGENVATRNLIVGLVENVHRLDLTPMERAWALGRLLEQGLTQAQIAQQTGLHPSTVNSSIALLELDDKGQELVHDRRLSAQEALSIVRRHRRRVRAKQGKSVTTGAQWEPDWFTPRHHLARKAAELCGGGGRGHSGRRRIGGVACGQCWETVIRLDEALVQQLRLQPDDGTDSPQAAAE